MIGKQMKSIKFQDIYNELKNWDYDYLQSTFERIIADEPKYIENFNKTFAELTDNAYNEIWTLFMNFGRDFIDFDKETGAMKATALHAGMRNLEPLAFECADYSKIKDYQNALIKRLSE